jgi:hypothetical protein
VRRVKPAADQSGDVPTRRSSGSVAASSARTTEAPHQPAARVRLPRGASVLDWTKVVAYETSYFFPFMACADRAFHNAISASLANITRTPLLPLLTRILPPLRSLWSASQSMNSGSSLVRPSNSRTPTMSSCFLRLTIHPFSAAPISGAKNARLRSTAMAAGQATQRLPERGMGSGGRWLWAELNACRRVRGAPSARLHRRGQATRKAGA